MRKGDRLSLEADKKSRLIQLDYDWNVFSLNFPISPIIIHPKNVQFMERLAFFLS